MPDRNFAQQYRWLLTPVSISASANVGVAVLFGVLTFDLPESAAKLFATLVVGSLALALGVTFTIIPRRVAILRQLGPGSPREDLRAAAGELFRLPRLVFWLSTSCWGLRS